MPEWCIVEVTEIEMFGKVFVVSTPSSDSQAYIDLESRTIDLNLDQIDIGVQIISLKITEANLLQDGTYVQHIQSKTFSVPIEIVEVEEEVEEVKIVEEETSEIPDFLADILEPKVDTTV